MHITTPRLAATLTAAALVASGAAAAYAATDEQAPGLDHGQQTITIHAADLTSGRTAEVAGGITAQRDGDTITFTAASPAGRASAKIQTIIADGDGADTFVLKAAPPAPGNENSEPSVTTVAATPAGPDVKPGTTFERIDPTKAASTITKAR